ncbi:uncharacterized protein LOC105767534 isoform X1 [Gossypium raimondii]|uniref:uncharacterized protein LOC105767534 isoform X1 n=1 Tax=Gossypium raimondii TaxID=29730 RepID=UPI00227B505E|nr:uncharacterized protein LOC105767534 isoform X1 [Gossypium raimondii]XP_052487521.1 uncharacterized protein LOC105767534 isoform X1 [Gossypium raimondii]
MVLQLTLFLFFFWFVSCYCFYYLLRFFFLFFNSCACDHSQYPEIRPAWSLLSPESSLLSPESSRIWLLSLITIANGGLYYFLYILKHQLDCIKVKSCMQSTILKHSFIFIFYFCITISVLMVFQESNLVLAGLVCSACIESKKGNMFWSMFSIISRHLLLFNLICQGLFSIGKALLHRTTVNGWGSLIWFYGDVTIIHQT